jgi:hypothetical protein
MRHSPAILAAQWPVEAEMQADEAFAIRFDRLAARIAKPKRKRSFWRRPSLP